jgi:hypothetical protein
MGSRAGEILFALDIQFACGAERAYLQRRLDEVLNAWRSTLNQHD